MRNTPNDVTEDNCMEKLCFLQIDEKGSHKIPILKDKWFDNIRLVLYTSKYEGDPWPTLPDDIKGKIEWEVMTLLCTKTDLQVKPYCRGGFMCCC
jgi:hypothetical protein